MSDQPTTSEEREAIAHRCYECLVERQIKVRWEQEVGDYGTVLSSWPEFDLGPPCPGRVVVDEPDRIYEHRWPTQEEIDEKDSEYTLQARCPFGKYYDNVPDPDIERVLGQHYERKRLIADIERLQAERDCAACRALHTMHATKGGDADALS